MGQKLSSDLQNHVLQDFGIQIPSLSSEKKLQNLIVCNLNGDQENGETKQAYAQIVNLDDVIDKKALKGCLISSKISNQFKSKITLQSYLNTDNSNKSGQVAIGLEKLLLREGCILNQELLQELLPIFYQHGNQEGQGFNLDNLKEVPLKPRHANFPKLLKVVKKENYAILFFPFMKPLEDVLLYYNTYLTQSEAKKLFIIYQILKAIQFLHKNLLFHGRLNPKNILLDEYLWVTLIGMEFYLSKSYERDYTYNLMVKALGDSILYKEPRQGCILQQWQRGYISNFQYLMMINHIAGRKSGNPNYHPIFPWVTDFTGEDFSKNWRDLKTSKFRLNKGDEQLDTTFKGPLPHHITHMLSDTSYYIYTARKTPVNVLKQHVRSPFCPQEYPSSLSRLYSWTPDECIPEFFSDISLFISMHEELPNLELPKWAKTHEEFIEKHQEALESDHVSCNLHHWIDLTFGIKLSGDQGIAAKNVALPLIADQPFESHHGVIQLFKDSHPPKLIFSKKDCSSANNILEQDPLNSSVSGLEQFEESNYFGMKYLTEKANIYKESPGVSFVKRNSNILSAITANYQAIDFIDLGKIILKLFDIPLSSEEDKFMNDGDNYSFDILVKISRRITENFLGNQVQSVTSLLDLFCKIPLEMMTADSFLNSTCFPNSFPKIFDFITDYHRRDSLGKIKLCINLLEDKSYSVEELLQILQPYFLKPFFNVDSIRLHMDFLKLFDVLSKHVGFTDTKKLLLQPILTLIDQKFDSGIIISKEFIYIMIKRFGLQTFTEAILPAYIRKFLPFPYKQDLSDVSIQEVQEKKTIKIHIITYICKLLGPQLASKFVLENIFTYALTQHFDLAARIMKEITELFGDVIIVSRCLPALYDHMEKALCKLSNENQTIFLNCLMLISECIARKPSKYCLKELMIRVPERFFLLYDPFQGFNCDGDSENPSECWRIKLTMHLTNFFLEVSQLLEIKDKTLLFRSITRPFYERKVSAGPFFYENKYTELIKIQISRVTTIISPDSDLSINKRDLRAEDIGIKESSGVKDEGSTEIFSLPVFKKYGADNASADILNWTRVVSNSIENSYADRFPFHDLKLRTFCGHTNAVKAISANEEQRLFVTGSKDSAAKLWKLDVFSDMEKGNSISTCIGTYNGHRHSIFDVFFSDTSIISCDGEIHMWDLNSFRPRITFKSGKMHYTSISKMSQKPKIIGGAFDGSLSVIDLYKNEFEHIWLTSKEPAVIVKDVEVQEQGHIYAAGLSSGQLVILDSRIGEILYTFKACESEISQVRFLNQDIICIGSSGSQSLTFFDLKTSSPVYTLKDNAEYVGFELYKGRELVRCLSGQEFHFMDTRDFTSSYSSPLKNGIVKSPVSGFTIAEINEMMLIGSLEGDIFLYA